MENMGTERVTVCFTGNPNCGKTTLFNAYTGAGKKTANWPGVTVELSEGSLMHRGRPVLLVDTPGIYSLDSYTMEETVTRQCIRDQKADVIIHVADALLLERSLFLSMQLLAEGRPMVLALNMMDLVRERGMDIDIGRLSGLLGGIPVIPVSARRRTGLEELMDAAVETARAHRTADGSGRFVSGACHSVYRSHSVHSDGPAYGDGPPGAGGSWSSPVSARELHDRARRFAAACIRYGGSSIQNKRNTDPGAGRVLDSFTGRADRILAHPVWGIPVFFGILALVFFLTFSAGGFLRGYFERGLAMLSAYILELLGRCRVSGWIISLVSDGVLAGVGGVLGFLPNIAILFLALTFLEDSGYMARIAWVMNGTMASAGLSGKAVLPVLLGFGCTVPAVLASRILENEKDRRRTILMTPFMSCSARLPVYVLFAGMFFPEASVAVIGGLYVLGVLAALGTAWAAWKAGREEPYEDILLMELPEYRWPDLGTVVSCAWERVRDYLEKAGTTIFLASLILWFFLHLGPQGDARDVSESFAAVLGRGLAPILVPAGLGTWQTAVALLTGLSAKEVVVSSFFILYGAGNRGAGRGHEALAASLAASGFTGASALALLVFCLLYTPCAAAMGTIRQETGSLRWTVGLAVYQLFLAWICAVLVYQAASRIPGLG